MFHGIKRSDVKKLTPEQIKKNEETLKKIKAIQEQILKIKKDLTYSQKTLDFLYKSAVIMPDYPTIWDVRKILIEKFIEKSSEDDIYALMKTEIKQLIPIMIKNPKTYLLWFHRIWCLIKAVEIEKKRDIKLENCILMGEIKLCNDFFKKDDRNFHCWNYRVNILTLIKKYYNETFDNFIEKELEFTLEKIKNNFSNFSAWHYRAKIIPIHFIQKKISWNTKDALNYFKDDLEMLKKAIYTDPKDQSPWNYHYWIINNFSPIYIINIDVNNDEKIIKIKYSNVFKVKNVLNIQENDENVELLNKNEFSDCAEIKIKNIQNFKEFKIENKVLDDINMDLDNLTLVTNKICFTKENLTLPKITILKNDDNSLSCEVNMSNVEEFQTNFLKEQIDMTNELIEKSTDFFIENAHYRLAQLYSIFYQINKFKDKNIAQDYMNKQLEQFKILSQKSKRMTSMYASLLKGLEESSK